MKPNFQTIIVIVFIVAFVGAVLVFSGLVGPTSTSSSTTASNATITIWGVLPNDQMQQYVSNFNINSGTYKLSYEERAPQTFYQDVITALANGNPPDMFILSSELLSQFKSRLYVTDYQTYNERTFRDTNIDGAQIFLDKDGVVAFPLLVDPLVVYYNKDILAAQNFVVPPTTWNNLQATLPFFTRRDTSNGISQTALGLGGSTNVTHARDIVSALILQTGNPIVSHNPLTGQHTAALSTASASGASLPASEALTFYTSFANPTSTNYSWNSSLPSSLEMFLAGRSAFYIGRSSELFTIQQQNPNLNFDVATLFQSEASARPVTFGSFVAVGILKNSPNIATAYPAALELSSRESIDALSKTFGLAPARRDLLLVQQQNPYVSVFFRAALSAFAWLDPNPVATEQLFRDMIDSVNSGRSDTQTAIFDANRDLQSSIR